jgi:hypothetical protein
MSSSPFISVSRRRRRLGVSRMTTVGAVAIVAALGLAMPAFGGPSALSVAKKALKTAKSANTKSNKALLLATRGPANESITSAKIANLTITNEDIAPGAVGTGKISNGAVRSEDLADGSVNVVDMAGANVTDGSINLPAIPANTCNTLDITITGAKPGDVPLLVFQDSDAIPAGLIFEIVKINAENSGRLRICNVATTASTPANGLGNRVITLR